jgi:polyhydroxyalkanoate synthesis regulator phasin
MLIINDYTLSLNKSCYSLFIVFKRGQVQNSSYKVSSTFHKLFILVAYTIAIAPNKQMERRDLMKKKLNRVLSCLVIGGLLLASGSAVLAASDTETQSAAPAVRASGPRGAGMEDNLKEVLDSLVSSSSITQEQADQLLALQAEKQAQMKSQWEEIKNLTPEERKSTNTEKPINRAGIFSDAVEQGIITEAERETICNALAEARQEQRQAELQERFAELVSQGIISQEQADTIIVQIQKAAAVQQAELEKVKDMSAEERQQYLQSKGEKANLLDDLIADGTLTQAQADDVAKLMGGGFHKSPPSQRTE